MAKFFGFYTNQRQQVPVVQNDGQVVGGNVRLYREVINLAAAAYTTADTIVVAYGQAGDMFVKGVLTATVSLVTSTIAIGVAGTTGKYRTAATFTAVDTPTLFGNTAAMCVTGAGATQGQAAKLSALEEIFITIAVANLPAAGFLVVDHYFAQT